MHYIYKAYSTSYFNKDFVFECDAEDIMAADKLFALHTGKKMSDKECNQVYTWSPDWNSNS